MIRALVTGFNGFVGQVLASALLGHGYAVRGAVRTASPTSGLDIASVGTVGPDTQWAPALRGIDTVVHLVARTHVLNEQSGDPLAGYRSTNVMGTERLATEAIAAGVRRFIYVSSIKVNGEGRTAPYRETDIPAPQDPYGISKWEAEQALHRVAAGTGMEVVILRPPLVYGPGVKANFLNLVSVVYKQLPLPLSGIRNIRSMIFVENLVDAIVTCISHRQAAGKTYLVSDGEDLSTPELARKIAGALDRRSRLFYVPVPFLQSVGHLIGRASTINRLTGSLHVSIDKIRTELGWSPPYTIQEGLEKTAAWYKHRIPSDR